MEFLFQPWPWYVAGPLIALVMFLLIYSGKTFGVSSNFRTICAIGGGGTFVDFFKFEWKDHIWNLVFLAGAVLGGFIAGQYMTPDKAIDLNPATVQALTDIGITGFNGSYLPDQIFSTEAISSYKGVLLLLIGGFLVGFGSRYAGGCTSGHAITGISTLQIPSIIAVIGFFIGGLIMTFFILPLIF